jgi:flagellar basal-body rod protein FlgC
METSGGAMQAERMRAEVVAANMANAETTRTASGTPYRRQHVVFASNTGSTTRPIRTSAAFSAMRPGVSSRRRSLRLSLAQSPARLLFPACTLPAL